MFKTILKIGGVCLGLLLLAVIGLVLWLTIREYRPDTAEAVSVDSRYLTQPAALAPGDSLKLVTMNTGYGGLDAGADFFMDGGKGVQPEKEQVLENLSQLREQLASYDADVCFLQEVDQDSKRSAGYDQTLSYLSYLGQQDSYASAFALNYSCDFVPYPWPPIGKVHSGVQTLSRFPMETAHRIALPCPFSWPVSTANLKRCLLVSHISLEGTDKQLVLVNLHLEAYDDGDGKAAQTQMLMNLLTTEYEKGNYVIAGGDFNQTFPGALEAFPVKDPTLWTPGTLEEEILPEHWRFACDLSVPTCRLLNQPYDAADSDTQLYVIDGFILSPNVKLERVETMDESFAHTDHNPVVLEVTLDP